MRRRTLLLAGAKYLFAGGMIASALAVASPAVHADGMAPRGAAPVAVANWSGFYVGTQTGFAWSQIDGALSGLPGAPAPLPAGPGAFSLDHDTDFAWGLMLGVQHQMGNVVLGVEGNWLSMIANKPGSTICPNPALSCTSRIDDILSVGGRLGWSMGHWMPYVSGGYASSSFSFRANTRAAIVGPPAIAAATGVEDGRTRNDGWYIGGGFDMVVAPGWTTGIEYRHYDFGNASSTAFSTGVAGTPIQGTPIETLTQNATVDTIALRLTYKWDIPGRYATAPLK
jgi:opacity protein-like surface antigen